MGWWSATIMGGDTPLDYEGDIYNIAGVSYEDAFEGEKTPEEIKGLLQDALPQIVKESGDRYDGEIYQQVVGVLTMRHGLDPKHKSTKAAIKMALAGAEEDEWAAEGDTERKGFVNAFIKQLKEYDGTPQEPAREGLLQKLNEHLAAKHDGLINK